MSTVIPVRSAHRRSGCGAPASTVKRLGPSLRDYASGLRDYASDFEVELADMFDPDQDIDYADPEDPDVNVEVHWLIGWVSCAALVLGMDPAALVAEQAMTENDT